MSTVEVTLEATTFEARRELDHLMFGSKKTVVVKLTNGWLIFVPTVLRAYEYDSKHGTDSTEPVRVTFFGQCFGIRSKIPDEKYQELTHLVVIKAVFGPAFTNVIKEGDRYEIR